MKTAFKILAILGGLGVAASVVVACAAIFFLVLYAEATAAQASEAACVGHVAAWFVNASNDIEDYDFETTSKSNDVYIVSADERRGARRFTCEVTWHDHERGYDPSDLDSYSVKINP